MGFVSPSLSLPISASVHPSDHPLVYSFVRSPSVSPSTSPSVHPSAHPLVYLFVRSPSVYPYISSSVHPSAHPLVYSFVRWSARPKYACSLIRPPARGQSALLQVVWVSLGQQLDMEFGKFGKISATEYHWKDKHMYSLMGKTTFG